VSILLALHDPAEATSLSGILEQAGFPVVVVQGEGELAGVDVHVFAVVAVGVIGGVDVRARLCRQLRAEAYLGAILALGAETSDIGALLDAGVDDFILAPVRASELVARVQMAVRRSVAGVRARLGPVEIDRAHRVALLRGKALPLTAREFSLLACLVEAGGELVSRADLLLKVWAREEDTGSNLVEVHLSRLRDKLGDDATMIETVRRAGYRLRRDA
jgi:DNA-binding response OmpR family regulator